MAAPMADETARKDEGFEHPYASDCKEASVWMRKYINVIRDCSYYKDEHKACNCLRGKFSNYYTYGEQADCEHWLKAYEACKKWKSEKDEEALDYVVSHELVRREFRLQTARNNDVWEYRSGPPEDWQHIPPRSSDQTSDAIKNLEEKESLTDKAKAEIKRFQEEVLTSKPKVNPKYDETVQRCIIL